MKPALRLLLPYPAPAKHVPRLLVALLAHVLLWAGVVSVVRVHEWLGLGAILLAGVVKERAWN